MLDAVRIIKKREWKDKLRVMKSISLGFRLSDLYKVALDKAVSRIDFGKRGGKMYVCAKCFHPFLKAEVQVDHISPIVQNYTSKREMSINEFVERTYCDESNLQVLCKPCHQVKTLQG